MHQMPKGLGFFTVPQLLVDGGYLSKMRPAEVSLYLLILHRSERISKPWVMLTNDQIKEQAGLSPSSVRTARTKLSERGLVRTQRTRGGVYEYTLTDPRTGEPLPKQFMERNTARPKTRILSSPERMMEPSAPGSHIPGPVRDEPGGVPLDWSS